jgi:hypothetical protein
MLADKTLHNKALGEPTVSAAQEHVSTAFGPRTFQDLLTLGSMQNLICFPAEIRVKDGQKIGGKH